MKSEDVLKLIGAGFSADEIRELMTTDEVTPRQKVEPNVTPKATPTAEPKAEPKSEPKAEQNDEPKDEPKDDKADKILSAIDRLTGTITTYMVTATGRITPDETTTVDDILAKILNPNEGV